MSLSIKFHEDPSFGCGDICKTILMFVENYMKLVETYGNYISKCPGISENMAPILAHMVLLNRSHSKILL